MPKVRSPWLAKGLEFVQNTLERYPIPASGAVNEAGRRALGAGFKRAAARALGEAARDFSVELRQSILEPGQFSLLHSDIDLALVSSDTLTPALIEKAKVAHARLHHWIPWTGELEIYTRREWMLRQGLVHGYFAPLMDLIWIMRKWSWQEAARETATTGYHRAKAARSIARAQKKLGLRSVDDLGRVISDRLAQVGVQPKIKGDTSPTDFPGFLGWQIRPAEFPGPLAPLAVRLPAELAIAFCAVLPDGEHHLPQAQSAVWEARQDASTAKAYVSVCAAEYQLSTSHLRVYGSNPLIELWLPKLVRLIKPYDLELAEALNPAGNGITDSHPASP